MDLEIQNLSRLSHKEIGNLNTPITRKEIKSVIKELPAKKKNPGHDSFPNESYQKFKELTPVILKHFFY